MQTNLLHYQAAADTNAIVHAGKCVLKGIIFGADVATSVVEVSDSEDDGDGNIKLKFSGDNLMTASGGMVEVNAVFENGITADIVNQTDVVFVYYPL